MYLITKSLCFKYFSFQDVEAIGASAVGGPADRNGSGPFRLNGGVEGVDAPAPAPETGSLPLYPPIAESTLGKVNIVIFSGINIIRRAAAL